MKNIPGFILVAILAISTAAPAAESSESSVAIVTGEVRDPTAREITFRYDTPTALGRKAENKVTLDSRNRFELEIPVVRGTLVRGSYKGRSVPWKWVRQAAAYVFKPGPLVLFVEPGDSLHVEIHPGRLYTSCRFSGRNADNSRLIAEWVPQIEAFRRKVASQDQDVDAFARMADRWRTDQLKYRDVRRTRYALSPGFVEYSSRYLNYLWADLRLSYAKNHRFALGPIDKSIPSDYYDFLEEVPLVDEEAIGVEPYQSFLMDVLDRELSEAILSRPSRLPSEVVGRPLRDRGEFEGPARSRRPRLSESYDLAGLGLSEKTLTRLDSLYEKDGLRPMLSKLVDLSALGFFPIVQARLDSMYEKKRLLRLSELYDLSAFGLSETAQAEVDSLYEESKTYRITSSSKEKEPRVATTGGMLVFYLPLEIKMDSLAREPLKLSEKIDLFGLGLSKGLQTQLDSLYANRRSLKLSQTLDLASLGLSQSVQAKLDSIYAIKKRTVVSSLPRRYDLAEKKLNGRVLYWFLAGELIRDFERGIKSFASVQRTWREFQATNPYAEYNEPVQAALRKAMALQPGRPAPDFTLTDLDGQAVSLSQFRGKVVLLDFWASWCGPCFADLPQIRDLKKKTAELPVVFVNLSLDSSDAAWRKAIDQHEIQGVHVRSGAWGSDVTNAYNVRAIPAYFLVDPQGMILERLSRVELMTDTDAIVAKILKSLGSV